MPRYYCDYCDTYLTHDSPSVRKQHNAGYKHKGNVRTYYQQFEAQLNQSLIDQKVKEHLGAFRPVGLPFPQLRPGLPVLPTPQMPMGGNPQMPGGSQWVPGMRPPVLPRPMPGVPGYAPPPMPQMLAPPGAPMPGQVNNMQRPGAPPGAIPGSVGMPASTGGPPMFAPPVYQGSTTVPANGGGDSSSINAQALDSNQ
ncbi:U1 small nuclear ribonucleoprotein C [Nicotiana tabacum]|uniref:U1 small nuclear ribonucleoprotein C n=1 Tax=Nicotiana tabacum TaxID=4097 RepID=A0A1S3YSE2_TOBAC|nr:U1 small nuclear ribonucleoprotein C-like [Nicotiana tomentosiformis]XP_016454870.1 PREDICTED: U1 small nuclear ribonucleoprotein C-like [Nicotiana tabacum]